MLISPPTLHTDGGPAPLLKWQRRCELWGSCCQMKLSLCAIAKNEAAALPQCLGSVAGLVDEMVVLDTGSSDRTPEIAREFGAQVYYFDWHNDFAAARNESLKYVTGDWVLVLDADEMLTPEVIPDIKAAIESDRYLLVNLVRQELGASQSPYSLVSRLFRNHPEIYFEHPYHAMVDDSVTRLMQAEPEQWAVGSLAKVAILHTGYQPGAIAEKNKLLMAQEILEQYLLTHPNDAYTCSKLGALYVQIGELNRGLKLLQLGLFSNKSIEPAVKYEIHYHLGIAYSRLSKLSKAKAEYETALREKMFPPLQLGAYNNLGNLLLETGDVTGAIAVYEMVLEIDPSLPAAYFNLALALRQKGRIPEAIANYKQAIALKPDYAEAYQNLGVTLLKAGNILEAMDAFKSAIAEYEQRQSPAAEQLRSQLAEIGFKL